MKNIYHKISIHPLMFFFLTIVLLTGNLKNYFFFLIIILAHELGHILFALLFKWHIDKICILPFGMITFFKDNMNKPIYEEFIILIMGPIFQIIFNYYFNNPYHYFLLFINLLPIYPLDGSKFFFLLFNKFKSYYQSFIMLFIISFITILLMIIIKEILLIYLMLLYLSIGLIKYMKCLNDILISFCFDRYKNKYNFKKSVLLNSFDLKKLQRCCYHYFKIGKKVISEDEIFVKMFDKTR